MSDRPTISVYTDDVLVECYYLRNWPMGSLFVECARLVRVIGDATEREDVLQRLGAEAKEGRSTEDLLRLESCSEYPVVIDLTRKLTYLKDDYPLGHPGQDGKTITSAEDYEQVSDSYVLWPPERPISFTVLMQVANMMEDVTPNGQAAAQSQNAFIDRELPQIVIGAIEDVGRVG